MRQSKPFALAAVLIAASAATAWGVLCSPSLGPQTLNVWITPIHPHVDVVTSEWTISKVACLSGTQYPPMCQITFNEILLYFDTSTNSFNQVGYLAGSPMNINCGASIANATANQNWGTRPAGTYILQANFYNNRNGTRLSQLNVKFVIPQ